MVKTARPVDANVRHVVVQLDGAVDGRSRVRLPQNHKNKKTGEKSTRYRRKYTDGNTASQTAHVCACVRGHPIYYPDLSLARSRGRRCGVTDNSSRHSQLLLLL